MEPEQHPIASMGCVVALVLSFSPSAFCSSTWVLYYFYFLVTEFSGVLSSNAGDNPKPEQR